MEAKGIRKEQNLTENSPNFVNPAHCCYAKVDNPIAICGMAVRLPGNLSNPSELWDFLMSKGDAKTQVPYSRYNADSYYAGTSERVGMARTKYGYFLDESIDLGAVDTSFFSFTRNELEYVVPQQRQMLEIVRECFESAGEVKYRGVNIGCYIGSFGEDWVENLFHDQQIYGKYPLMIGSDFTLPNRISFEYDLRGPSMSIRTACSSGLICLHEACSAIARGECSSAIVGSCNLILSPTMTVIMSAKGILSPDGSCKSFDVAADGYGRAEAINAVYIKPLKDALRDGNPIRAIIRATAVNNDGKTAGVNAPSITGQEALIRKAYAAAGIGDISQTPFFECHGTGTPVGDPVEVTAISNIIGSAETYIGSVKPNVGHAGGASGITSLIKTVLALENETIPPNIKFNNPNPNIPFHSSKIRVPVETVTWPEGRPLRASVNSFGMGGANAHAILESGKDYSMSSHSHSFRMGTQNPTVLLLSANTLESLERNLEKHHEYLEHNPLSLTDLPFTLATKREHMRFRVASIVDKTRTITTTEFVKAPLSSPKLIMVFTGQGAQWPGMGRKLYQSNMVFKQALNNLDDVLHSLQDAPPWSIGDEINRTDKDSNLQSARYAQPISTTIQIGLIDVLRSLDIVPAVVIGHSSGELAAAYAAGHLTARETFLAAFYRGRVSEQIPKKGMMAAVGMGVEDIRPFCTPGVVVGCENSPSNVTLSGDPERLLQVLKAIAIANPGIVTRLLRVDVAYHSHHMKHIGQHYRQLLDGIFINSNAPRQEPTAFYSSLKGRCLLKGEALDSQYWQSNLESPVLFHSALKQLISDHSQEKLLFLEVGPHSALSGPIRQCLEQESRKDSYISCLTRFEDSSEAMLSAIANLYCQNISVNLDILTNCDGTARTLHDLPTYSWNRNYSRMYMPRENKEWRWCQHRRHEMLGIRVIDSTDDDPSWRNVLHFEHLGWLRDHKVGGVVVFPAAGYLSMVGAALTQITAVRSGFRIQDLVLSAALILTDTKSAEMLLSMHRIDASDWFHFAISSHNGTGWTKHCYGRAKEDNAELPVQNDYGLDLTRHIDSRRWYGTLTRGGIDYGPAFQGVQDLTCCTTRPVAGATIQSTIENSELYQIHPTKLDAFFQTILCAIYGGLDWVVDQLPVPISMEEIVIGCCSSDLKTKYRITSDQRLKLSADGTAWLSNGGVVVQLKGAVLRRAIADSQTPGRGDYPVQDWAEYSKSLGHLTSFCIHEACLRLREYGVSSKLPHLQKYQEWLEEQSCPGLESEVENIRTKVLACPAALCANAMEKVLENVIPIFNGKIQPLEVLTADNTLAKLYNYLNLTDRTALFQALGHHKPRQRILEIGAGTGGTTAKLIQHTSYSTYTYTDISAAFFPAAKDRFGEYNNIIYNTLDISKNPLDQGFRPGSFDLIVAANVLHATASLHETLTNVRRLLHPQGKLFLEELSTETKFINFIAGLLPGWWEGEADGRPNQPYVSPDRWQKELEAAGFQVDDIAFDTAPPYNVNAYILASQSSSGAIALKSMTLLCDESSTEIAERLRHEAADQGYSITTQCITEALPLGQDVISLLDVVAPYFNDRDEDKLSAFQFFLDQLQLSDAGVLWVSQTSQTTCDDPNFSLGIGVGRTVRAELQVDFATCEIDQLGTSTRALIDIFSKFSKCRAGSDVSSREYEYIIHDRSVLVGRIIPFSMQQSLEQVSHVAEEDRRVSLRFYENALNLAQWEPATASLVLRPDEVEIEVDTLGLHLGDLQANLDTVEPYGGALGLDASGVVSRAGSAVTTLTLGDRIICFSLGTLSTSMMVPVARCVRIPESLSLEDAATMPLAFSTAIHALVDIGHLKSSQVDTRLIVLTDSICLPLI